MRHIRQTQENGAAAEHELQEHYISAEEDQAVPMVEVVYSEDEAYPALAAFLKEYYQIPDEYCSETRYYYNYTDLNEDGEQEIFAVVIGEYTGQPSGDPALILSVRDGDVFEVIESFASLQTPVTVSEVMTNGWHELIYYGHGRDEQDGYRSLQTPVTVSEVMTNGWHELIYYGHGRDEQDGYRICRYNPDGGYQTALSEIKDEIEPVGGRRILSDNLIDDMDKGDYLTLVSEPDKGDR